MLLQVDFGRCRAQAHAVCRCACGCSGWCASSSFMLNDLPAAATIWWQSWPSVLHGCFQAHATAYVHKCVHLKAHRIGSGLGESFFGGVIIGSGRSEVRADRVGTWSACAAVGRAAGTPCTPDACVHAHMRAHAHIHAYMYMRMHVWMGRLTRSCLRKPRAAPSSLAILHSAAQCATYTHARACALARKHMCA